MATVKIPTLPFLGWAIWALILPITMAHHHHVDWKDLMVATNKFPRFFGEVPSISRTGSPRVVGLTYTNGHVEPMKCSGEPAGATAKDFHCELDCKCLLVNHEFRTAIDQLQRYSPPQLNDLTFITNDYNGVKYVGGTVWYRHFWFNQTNLGGTIAIDNTVVQLNLNTDDNGTVWTAPEGDRVQIYTGEFDHGSSTPSCTELEARGTAEYTALNQPFWDALYPPKESKLVYTVQDGRLYLTWRVTFNLKDKVGDDFVVWVDARDCRRVVAAAPAEMDTYIKSLEDFDKASEQLFLDHGLSLEHVSR